MPVLECVTRVTAASRASLGQSPPAMSAIARTIYVLRSKSDHPTVDQHRQVLHKIGVTNGRVEQRIAGARLQPTYLMADVEIVATYELFNVNAHKLEKLLHRFFSEVTLDIEIPDRFGNAVRPREWFLVPLPVIDKVVELVRGRRRDPVHQPPSGGGENTRHGRRGGRGGSCGRDPARHH